MNPSRVYNDAGDAYYDPLPLVRTPTPSSPEPIVPRTPTPRTQDHSPPRTPNHSPPPGPIVIPAETQRHEHTFQEIRRERDIVFLLRRLGNQPKIIHIPGFNTMNNGMFIIKNDDYYVLKLSEDDDDEYEKIIPGKQSLWFNITGGKGFYFADFDKMRRLIRRLFKAGNPLFGGKKTKNIRRIRRTRRTRTRTRK